MYTRQREPVPAKFTTASKDGVVESIEVIGGCNGNLKGICRLITGMPVEQVIKAFKGVDCGGRGTSCPDQIAQALEQAK